MPYDYRNEEMLALAGEKEDQPALSVYARIPFSMLSEELDDLANDYLLELTEICNYYKIYERGIDFPTEGSNGDYTPSQLHYRMTKGLIDKEARFLFAEPPSIKVEPKGDVGIPSKFAVDMITTYNDLITSVLNKNLWEQKIVKGARDAFVGKRVALMVNFNDEDGITLQFVPSLQYIYETKVGNPDVLTKFVAFVVVRESMQRSKQRIFKKKYELVDGSVYVEDKIYDGAGQQVEVITPRKKINLTRIPVVNILNDGLTSDLDGESEVKNLMDYEKWYSKLSNADIDAERKSMNPIKYTVDMAGESTKELSTAAGAYWDLGTDQNLDKPTASVGMLEPAMSYSGALKSTLERIKTVGYEQVDMPDVALQTMTGAITSGKALKAVYWPLIVRCKEKMKVWGPQLMKIMEIIIEGAIAYPNIAAKYINDIIQPVDFEVIVEQNNPLPEDEIEDKTMDLNEIGQQVMSRSSYMKKWRGLTDDEISQELQQIARENEIINGSFGYEGDMGGGEMGAGEQPAEGEEQSIQPSDESQEFQGILDSMQSLLGQIGGGANGEAGGQPASA